MKRNRAAEIARPIALAAVAFAGLTFATAANAQYKAVSDDGIAASPKVRQMLNERKASAAPIVAAAPAMACSKCAEVVTTEVNPHAKGGEVLAGAATWGGVRHTCTACDIKLTVVGESKAKRSVVTHKCPADVPNAATCCAMN